MHPKIYKTVPATVEAMQMTTFEDQIKALFNWIDSSKKNLAFLRREEKRLCLVLEESNVFPGMWVVKEQTGTFRVLSSGEFNALYKPII